jgi:putative hydrolase of HD superfamily
VEGLDALITEYEKEMMEQEFYGLLPRDWHAELRLFSEDPFGSVAMVDGQRVCHSSLEISRRFNEDRYAPRDGELVKAADRLAAFIEVYLAVRDGSGSPELHEALWSIRRDEAQKNVGGVNLGEIYADFD